MSATKVLEGVVRYCQQRPLTACYGIATYGFEVHAFSELIERAEQAPSQAKFHGPDWITPSDDECGDLCQALNASVERRGTQGFDNPGLSVH